MRIGGKFVARTGGRIDAGTQHEHGRHAAVRISPSRQARRKQMVVRDRLALPEGVPG